MTDTVPRIPLGPRCVCSEARSPSPRYRRPATREAGPRRAPRRCSPGADARTRHHTWIREHGTDLPEVAEWSWNA